ncbi:MAG TPA: aminodeoxychorismate/anthranilate synthase component II [Candidatus Brocadiia bacterium]|nr:aminodeoxychorismate/anthranilate synthase component II [Candidatus Brocadiia bacterium]
MTLVIDNYDSFTYNLVQLLGEVGERDIEVYRNDEITVRGVAHRRPRRIIISPGPCTPLQAGVSNDVVRAFAGRIPILGVCLGHQCIGHVYGAKVERARRMMHGKTSLVRHTGHGIFEGLKNPFVAMRYHSLWVKRDTIPAALDVCAWSDDDEVMAMAAPSKALFGVQFHPESFMTDEGPKLMKNFLRVEA